MKRTLTLLAILALSTGVLAQDVSKATDQTTYGDALYLDSRTALTGTWTCTTTSLDCTSASGDAQTELADGDVVELCGYRYVVDGEPADADTITITPHRVASTGALRSGATAACSAQAGYLANLGLTATAAVVNDGSGTDSPLSLDTSTVHAAALEVGGGYAGGSGATVSAAGVGQFNGAVTVDGAAALNGGISVDSPAFTVANTTGALSSTGLATLTGGLTLGADDDASNLILHDASTIQIYDASDDTSVTVGPVANGTTTLGITGSVSVSGSVDAVGHSNFGGGYGGGSGCTLYTDGQLACNAAITGGTSITAATLTANTAAIIPSGAAPAATCTVGSIFIDTDESNDANCATTADNSLCICTASNTWTALENN